MLVGFRLQGCRIPPTQRAQGAFEAENHSHPLDYACSRGEPGVWPPLDSAALSNGPQFIRQLFTENGIFCDAVLIGSLCPCITTTTCDRTWP